MIIPITAVFLDAEILYINESTGCADLAINPKNPSVIYASMWEFRRTAWSFNSGGEKMTYIPCLNDSNDTIDLLEHQVRTGSGTNQQDLTISRISVSTYASIPNKLTQGRPIQVYIERLRDNPKINVWPVPDKSGYVFKYYRMRRIEDAGSGVQTADMNFRFFPCMVAGLAYYVAMKDPELAERLPMLKAEYEEQFRLAAEEDRVKTPAKFVPRIARI